MVQRIITAEYNYAQLDDYIKEIGSKKILIVCDTSIQYLTQLNKYLTRLENDGISLIRFSEFQSNPSYESAVKGVELFNEKQCDSIIAVGGGSAIDVAKCIKLYCNMDNKKIFLEQDIVPNDIPFLAMPTTAGTGSEATKYAVIYYKGTKQSVSDDSCIPKTVLLDASVLKSLPAYHRKSTMLDALCHAIESFWSINSTEESKGYSKKAIECIMKSYDAYLANTDDGNASMLIAANMAGKAINIAQTTAGHAMCYKLTSLYGIAHGHAAALCNRVLFPWMIKNTNKCIDARGEEYLKSILEQIADAMGCHNAVNAADKLKNLFTQLTLVVPKATGNDLGILVGSVNPIRLKNHPIQLDENTIYALYSDILM